MQLQYISDNQGHTTAVQIQIPIEDWQALKEKYRELEQEEKNAYTPLPDWQIGKVEEELKLIAAGTADIKGWEDTQKELKR